MNFRGHGTSTKSRLTMKLKIFTTLMTTKTLFDDGVNPRRARCIVIRALTRNTEFLRCGEVNNRARKGSVAVWYPPSRNMTRNTPPCKDARAWIPLRKVMTKTVVSIRSITPQAQASPEMCNVRQMNLSPVRELTCAPAWRQYIRKQYGDT